MYLVTSLLELLILGSHLLEHFHQTFNFLVHFLRESSNLLLCLFLEIVKSFRLLTKIFLFLLSVGSISYISCKRWHNEKVSRYFNSQTKRCCKKKYSLCCFVNAWSLTRCIHHNQSVDLNSKSIDRFLYDKSFYWNTVARSWLKGVF